jgi:hypothetical protein
MRSQVSYSAYVPGIFDLVSGVTPQAEAEGKPPQYDGRWRDADPEVFPILAIQPSSVVAYAHARAALSCIHRLIGSPRCSCLKVVKAKLEAGEPHTIRFKVPPNTVVGIDDYVRGQVRRDACRSCVVQTSISGAMGRRGIVGRLHRIAIERHACL